MELAGENCIKTVYDLQSYWTSMAAILASLGFTFLIDRMTEVLTPDIYRAHWSALVTIYQTDMIKGVNPPNPNATLPPNPNRKDVLINIRLKYSNF
jgi:hypothetical protein